MKVPAERLKQVLGITQVTSIAALYHLAVIDSPLQHATDNMKKGA